MTDHTAAFLGFVQITVFAAVVVAMTSWAAHAGQITCTSTRVGNTTYTTCR